MSNSDEQEKKPSRRLFLKSTTGGLLAAALGSRIVRAASSTTASHTVSDNALASNKQRQTSPRRASSRPLNVLFIMADDMNTDLACYGNPIVKSPNLDRLARRGVRFDRTYCQFPICNPSRTSMLSGRRPETTKVFGNPAPYRPRYALGNDVDFLPESFHRHGYFTARVGKIAHDEYANEIKWDISETAVLHPTPLNDPLKIGLHYVATNDTNIDEVNDARTARRVVQLLEEASKNKDKPFFVGAGFHKPHLPLIAPPQFFALYPPEKIKLPRELGEPIDDRKDIPDIALKTYSPATRAADERMTDDERRRVIAAYYACISYVDAQIGLLLDTLERLKLTDNTIVVFLADHGFLHAEHGLWRKLSLFEESARVPLIVSAPGRRRGATSTRLVESVDMYPTLAELCGLPAPEGMEGTSLVPLLDEPDRLWKQAAFTMTKIAGNTFGHSVRTERYRYNEWGEGKEQALELYDHANDGREYTNLANDPKHAATLAEMQRLMRDGWRTVLPQPNRRSKGA